MGELSFSFGVSKRDVFYEEAKSIIEEYPEDEHYIQANYSMWFHPSVGMDDNSIELHRFWHLCRRLVEDYEKEISYSCIDCEWTGDNSSCEFDTEYDEFKRIDRKYPICPKCGGGLNH
jgi:hypothetical protein